MKLIETYILRRVLTLFFAVLLGSIGITWIVQLLARINFLTTSGQTFWTFFTFSTLIIPSVVPLVIPFALVIAVVLVFNAMNQDSELVVISAAGSSRYIVWRPVLFLAFLTAIVSFVTTNYVAPHARINMRQMMATANSDFINLFLQAGSFREPKENIYLAIGEPTSDGKIGEIFIVNKTDPAFDINYYAISGYVASNSHGDYLVMENGEIQRRNTKTGDISIIKFDTDTFDLSEFAPANGTVVIYPKDQFLSDLFKPDPNSSYFQRHPQEYTAEIHRRLTSWLYPIVFALIALTSIGNAQSHRQNSTPSILIAFGFTFVIFLLSYFIGDKANNDVAYIPFLYIVPIFTIVFLFYLLLSNRQLSIPQSWQDFFVFVVSKLKFKKDKSVLVSKGDL